uniref:Uncharacterized protein n=1 Tax=viral metagenome TaxID=1070528 RepID=A0A6C0JKZ8_9ZZZZ
MLIIYVNIKSFLNSFHNIYKKVMQCIFWMIILVFAAEWCKMIF